MTAAVESEPAITLEKVHAVTALVAGRAWLARPRIRRGCEEGEGVMLHGKELTRVVLMGLLFGREEIVRGSRLYWFRLRLSLGPSPTSPAAPQ